MARLTVRQAPPVRMPPQYQAMLDAIPRQATPLDGLLTLLGWALACMTIIGIFWLCLSIGRKG